MYEIYKDGLSMCLIEEEPTQDILQELGGDSYSVYEKQETEQEKKSRIRELVVYQTNLSSVDIEWVEFSDREIGDIIVDRVFWWNPHAESALQAKISSYIISVISGEPNIELLNEIEDKQKGVNEVRNKFWLSSLVA